MSRLSLFTSWKHVSRVLKEADIILEVLDSREIEHTRNQDLEQRVRRMGKKLIYVFNKCDLANVKDLHKAKEHFTPGVFVSSTKRLGTTLLKKKIQELAHGKKVTVGVVGYPNVGKSSLINALAGRAAARTSPESGFTRGMQKIRVSEKIMLLDTPGVFGKKDTFILTKISSINYGKIKDPEGIALKVIDAQTDLVKKRYAVEGRDAEEILEQLALKKGKVRKGGIPDTEAAARFLLKEWQEGKLEM